MKFLNILLKIVKLILIVFLVEILSPISSEAILPPSNLRVDLSYYYIRTDGGTALECTGRTDAAYTGSGTKQNCAWKHPFEAFPPGGTARISGGDTLIIGSGSYRMGNTSGVYDSGACNKAWPYDCYMSPIPSGTLSNPTRILGQGWDTEVGAKPELYAVERSRYVLNLAGSSFVEVQYLDITDHDSCVDNSNHADMACNRSSYPYGDWGLVGLYASASSDVLLRNIDIHGLTTGVHAGGLADWTVQNVTIRGNGMVGWDGDIGASSSNSGTQSFTNFLVEWNGCVEQYPSKSIAGCWGQTSGGYGDGFGTTYTGGNWIFTDSQFLHNTSDGLDLLYNDGTGTTTINRVRSEGNAGNALKISGDTTIANSVLIGNCNYFTGSAEETGTEYVDDCRALGNTLVLNNPVSGSQYAVVNTTITGENDVLVQSGGDYCDGSENLVFQNVIMKGDEQAINPGYAGELASYYFAAGRAGTNDGPCLGSGLPIQINNSIIYNVKETTLCPNSNNVLCSDPLFTNSVTIGGGVIDVTLRATSPAIDKKSLGVGASVLGPFVVPATDYLGSVRTLEVVDWGAYVYGD